MLTVYNWIDGVAPFTSQEAGDNSGLLVGSMQQAVDTILLALDVTPAVLDEAAKLGAQLIISHHPLMFSPIQQVTTDTYEGRLISRLITHGIALIAAHTNADQSLYSGTLAVADQMHLSNLRREGPYVWAGDLPEEQTVQALCANIGDALGGSPIAHGLPTHLVRSLAIAGGSYSQGYVEAAALGAQALLTGEVRHHHALYANGAGIVLIAGGHPETEIPMLKPLARGLQSYLNGLEYKVAVHVSSLHPYG